MTEDSLNADYNASRWFEGALAARIVREEFHATPLIDVLVDLIFQQTCLVTSTLRLGDVIIKECMIFALKTSDTRCHQIDVVIGAFREQ